MKTFSQFSQEREKNINFDIPAVVITHGSHANMPEIPNLYIQHGSHSRPRKLTEETKSLREVLNGPHPNQHLGFNLTDANDRMEELHSNVDMNEDEIRHVKSYTRDSKKLNMSLHSNEGDETKLSEDHQKQVKHLDTAIDKHELPKMVLMSGIKFDPREKTKDSGGIFKSPSYVSSTLNPSVASYFAPAIESPFNATQEREQHILKIHVNDGDKGLYVGNKGKGYRGLTADKESEVILPRNKHFKIMPNPTTYDDAGTPTHIWDTHIIPDGVNPHAWQPPKETK